MTDTAPGKTLTTVKTEVAPVIMAIAEKKACNTYKTISVVTLFGPRKPKHKLRKVYPFTLLIGYSDRVEVAMGSAVAIFKQNLLDNSKI